MRIRVFNLLVAFILIGGVLFSPSGSSAATGNITENLQIIQPMYKPVGSDYIELQAIMIRNRQKEDGSQEFYRVPVTIMYPQNPAHCNGVAILDIINSVFYETYDFIGTDGDPFFPSVFPLAQMNLGDAFIQGRGYVYAQTQWNKLVIDRQRASGRLEDPSLKIERGTDGYLILRDLSNVLRNPSKFITGTVPTVCAANDVIGFGYSQTGMLLRQFYFSGLNSKLALSSDFDEGLVFEASLQAAPGSHCRTMTDQYPYYSYSFGNCGGETPKKQGKVITINTETDTQIINGWKARPMGNGSKDYYRLYELAGTSHIPSSLFSLKGLKVRPDDMAEQNFADTAPVFRAMVEHLRNWINDTEDPPDNVFLEGDTDHLNMPFFSSSSWGSDNNLVWLINVGEDGNALGGIRLPHIRTILPNGQEVGGPLGIFRGVECGNDPIQNTYLLDCQLSGDGNIYNMVGGTFKPYTDFDPSFCSDYYDSNDTYLNSVASAATFAISKGWILADEMESLLATAADNAQKYPGCVP